MIIIIMLHGFRSQDMPPDIAPPLAHTRAAKQDLVAQKVVPTIKINAAAIVRPRPIQFAVNPCRSPR